MTKLQFAIVATDVLIMRMRAGMVEVATQAIHRPPHYTHISAFIGGILKPEETSLHAATRIIREKTALDPKHIFLTPLKFYDRVDRDRRGRVIAIAYIGIMDSIAEASAQTAWLPLRQVGHLAYDHNEMQGDLLTYMQEHLFRTTIALRFMPKEFTIAQLKTLYEYFLDKSIDKRNFYKFIAELPIKETGVYAKEGRGRPAMLYKKASLTEKDFYLA
jgi:8-oxo-dGTP diphosphatase